MDELTRSLTGIIVAIIGVAILSVIVSKNANTVGVIQAAASGLGNTLATATAPVTGASITPNLAYPSSGGSGGFGNLSMGSFGSTGFGGGNSFGLA